MQEPTSAELTKLYSKIQDLGREERFEELNQFIMDFADGLSPALTPTVTMVAYLRYTWAFQQNLAGWNDFQSRVRAALKARNYDMKL